MNFSYILDEDHFICGGPVNNGGNVLQWLKKCFLQDKYEVEEIFSIAEKVAPGSEGLIFLPFIHGERAPVWDDESCGVFFGIRSIHNQTHFIRAALEGVCFALKNILVLLEMESEEIREIKLSGGFTKSGVWVQMLADVTGKKLIIEQNEDASAMGAAFLGIKAMGLIKDYKELNVGSAIEILPDTSNQIDYENSFRIFKELYPSLTGLMHLNSGLRKER